MAKEFDNTNRGSLWKNDGKVQDSQPDFRGDLNVNGQEYWVSGWKRKEGANPKSPALSFSIQLKEKKPHSAANTVAGNQAPEPKGNFDNFEDDIPW